MLIIRQHDSNLTEGRQKEEKKWNGWAPVASDDSGDDQTTATTTTTTEPQQLKT